jgi:hypothetical protein
MRQCYQVRVWTGVLQITEGPSQSCSNAIDYRLSAAITVLYSMRTLLPDKSVMKRLRQCKYENHSIRLSVHRHNLDTGHQQS